MNPYYAAPPPQQQQHLSRPSVDLDDLFGGPTTANEHKPPHVAPGEPVPPPYDALNTGYSSAPPPGNHVAAPALPQSYNGYSNGNQSFYSGAAHHQQQQQQSYNLPAAVPVSTSPYGIPAPPNASSSPSLIMPGMAPPPQLPQQQQQYGVAPRSYDACPSAPANGMVAAAPLFQQQPQVYAQQVQLQQPMPEPTQQQQQQQQLFPSSSSGGVNPSGAAVVAVPTAAAGIGSGAAPSRSAEEDDRLQLERIIRLRRELEQEQEREQRKKEELQTWGCSVCTFRNKLNEVKCEMCGSTRSGYTAPAATDQPAQLRQQQIPSAASLSHSNAGVTDWQCGMCLAPNEAHAERCKVCYAYRSSGTPVPRASPSGAAANANPLGVASSTPFTTNWKCSVCGEVNPPSKANCKVCSGFQRNGTPVTDAVTAPTNESSHRAHANSSADPPLPTVWSCSVCTFENSVSAALCKACESGQRPRHLAPKDKEKRTGSKHNDSRDSSSKDGYSGGEKSSSSKHQWPCGTCTFLNPIGRKKCDMCGAKRPESYAAEADTTEAQAAAKQEAQDDAEEIAWQDDDSVTECNNCHTTFTFLIRRHHCRLCGYVFCAHCSNYSLPLTMGGLPQRVCVNCYKARLEEEKKTKKARRWLDN